MIKRHDDDCLLFNWKESLYVYNLHIRLNKVWSNSKHLWSNRIKNENRMIAFLIQWEKFSFESSVNFSEVAGELPEKVWYETPYLFRMIEHEWKKLRNPSNKLVRVRVNASIYEREFCFGVCVFTIRRMTPKVLASLHFKYISIIE